MPLTTQQMANVGSALPANQLNADAAQQISNAIGKITAGNMFGQAGTISGLADIHGWRVDRQNAPSGQINISIQRNNVGAPSTVASVFVPVRYNSAPPPPNAGQGERDRFQANMKELERTVRQGLEQSFMTYAAPLPAPTANTRIINRFEVTGNFSA